MVLQFHITCESTENNGYITAINTLEFQQPGVLQTSLEVPLELLSIFTDVMPVRVISTMHMNVSALFHDGLPTRNM